MAAGGPTTPDHATSGGGQLEIFNKIAECCENPGIDGNMGGQYLQVVSDCMESRRVSHGLNVI